MTEQAATSSTKEQATSSLLMNWVSTTLDDNPILRTCVWGALGLLIARIVANLLMGNSVISNLRKKEEEPLPAGSQQGVDETGGGEESEDAERPPKKEFPEEPDVDPERIINCEFLKKFDGDQDRMYIGVCGLVFDVHPSDNFRPDFGYGKLWGGRDCTLSLATMSLKPDDAARFDWKFEDLGYQNFASLKSWMDHFKKKYKIVGRLEEYSDWDFSFLENLQEPKDEQEAQPAQGQEEGEEETGEGDKVD